MRRMPWLFLFALAGIVRPSQVLAQDAAPANAPKTQQQARPQPREVRTDGRSDPSVAKVQDPVPLNELPMPPAIPIATDDGSGSSLRSLPLEMALYGAITQNPDLVALRQTTAASAEAVETARHFPVTLNPTLWLEARPWNFTPIRENGATLREAKLPGYLYVSLRQPIELGHQQRYRERIAEAAYTQTRWNQVQAELTALVQTYRFYETAAYRREKLRIASDLAEFNHKLVSTLERRLEDNQVTPADLALARVEDEASRQLVEAARLDYATALSDLHTQLGTPETAGRVEPSSDFVLPPYIPEAEEAQLIELAIQSRPEIHAAAAQVDGARAAIGLARGDRLPTPVVGPVYVRDEALIQYYGFVLVTPIPVWNSGKPLVRQREAEYRQAVVRFEQVRERTIAQVRTALARWNSASKQVKAVAGVTPTLQRQVEVLERLFDEGQTDLNKLLQAQQRLIQLENARLDAIWGATQAQSDLLTALGARSLLDALPQGGAEPIASFPMQLLPEPR